MKFDAYSYPQTITPSQVSQTAAKASSRQPIYVDYLLGLAPERARRILIALLLCFVVFEVAARVFDAPYSRTAVSSLHGLRSIFQNSVADPNPKIIAVGDSTLVGGGVADSRATVMGLFGTSLCDNLSIYNLAVPAGENSTSVLMLKALRSQGVSNVKTVVIETIPSKFFGVQSDPVTIEELRRFIPSINPQGMRLPAEHLSLSEGIERQAQWNLGQTSRFYFHRDWMRTQVMGNYPVFWMIGRLLPKSFMVRFAGNAAQGTNRFGANLEDYPFDPSKVPPTETRVIDFRPEKEAGYLREAVAEAKRLGATPVILSFPLHERALGLAPKAQPNLELALKKYENFIRTLARQSGSRLIFCQSKDYRDSALWTRTPAHFNRKGSLKVWSQVKKEMCRLYTCNCGTSEKGDR